MHFESTHWLALLLFVPLLWKLLPRAQIAAPLRLAVILLLILALARPALERALAGARLWVLVDRSASAQQVLSQRLPEWERLIQQGAQQEDRVSFVDYADIAALRGESDAAHFQKSLEESRLALALQLVQTRLDPERQDRVLVLTDGFSTDDVSALGPALKQSGVVLDYRLFDVQDPSEVRVAELRGPARVRAGESFVLEARVRGPIGETVPYKIFKGGQELASSSLQLESSGALLRFTDALAAGSGALQYEIQLSPQRDGFSGNNRGSFWVESGAAQRVLLATSQQGDPLAALLRDKKVEVLEVSNPGKLSVGLLASAQAVLINNVPAYRIPRDFLSSLDFFVRVQGGGFAMLGGKQSFGSGGYYQSAVDALLPVSMELRDEKRKAPAALVLALDRSGSMGASVAGNMGSMTKMDLANEGAARSINLMGFSDEVALLAVDSSPNIVVPLQKIGGAAQHLEQQARSVSVGGGGIYVYEALKAAWTELEKSSAKTRHVILFSDAADSEEPGEYQSLLKEMTAKGASVSVIGLGTESDVDAPLLKDIALRGNGRLFFVDNALDVPAVFAQETVAVARSSFETEPVAVDVQPAWREFLRQGTLPAPARIDGYNLNYLRPEASTAWIAKHEYESPLFAFWRRGAGKAAALSFPVSAEYSESVRRWPGLAPFVELLVSYLKRAELPPGLFLRSRASSVGIEIELHYRDSWNAALAERSARLLVQGIDGSAEREIPWSRAKPGLLRAQVPGPISTALRGAVLIGEHSLPFGPIGLATSAEWDFEPTQQQALQQLAHYSGGRERADFASLWNFPRTADMQPLQSFLLLLALLLILIEALLTRLGVPARWPARAQLQQLLRPAGWNLGRIRWPHWQRRVAHKKRVRPELENPAPESESINALADQPKPEAPPSDEQQAQRDAFMKAKRRGL
jgi:Mg-chelatase subunit ChlD